MQQPFVIIPTAVRWRSENSITVIPTDWTQTPLEIEVFVTSKEDVTSLSEQLFVEKRIVSDRGAAQIFTFNTSHKPDALEYGIKVSVTGHKDYSVVLFGVANLKTISIQTDKGFYRPGENINVRILPINEENELYSLPLKVSLVNPQGFNVITNTITAGNRFIQAKFDLPEFAPIGFWSITAIPVNSTLPWTLSSVRIRVEDYSLPKFFVTMAVIETVSDSEVNISIHARYSHGQAVKGSVVVVCGTQTELQIGNLVEGSWDAKTDISRCLGSPSNGIIRFSATITDMDNDKNVAIREFQPRAPNFQMIPLRPFYDETTKSFKIYFKSLLSEAKGDKIECVYQCISSDSDQNGLNSSFSSRVEDTMDFEIDSSCMIYIIRAKRIIGTRVSDEVFLALPSVSSIDELNLSLINPLKKAVFKVEETFEASIPSLMNYVVICNRKSLVRQGSVGINGILNFPIQKNMQGFCILHVFGAFMNSKKTQSDMLIFFVEPSTCSNEFSLKSSAKTVRPPVNVTLTIRARPMSLAIVRGIDEKLYHIVNAIQAPKASIYWNLNVFNEPSREENAPRLINFINSMNVYQKIKKICQSAAKRAPSNPFSSLKTIQEVSDLSNYCAREFNRSTVAIIGDVQAIKEGRKTASATMFMTRTKPKASAILPFENDTPNPTVKIEPEDDDGKDELFLRTFFPEVWYFNDLKFGAHSEKKLHLEAPHSISKWSFTSAFWTPGEPEVCSIKPLTIETRRHVFMEVDLPNNVYENETVQARIIVNGDNFGDEQKLAVCFTGLSPVVCADMGRNGYMAETEYTRVILNRTQTRSEKFIYLKFLKEGLQNVSFELREEIEVIGGDAHHCADDKAIKFDRILKVVNVKRRLDQKEHFRQVNIYAQRKIYESSEATDGNLLEKSNIIQFKQKILNDDEIETAIEVDQDVQIIATSIEFAEYQPSFPLGVASEEISIPIRTRRSALPKSLASTLMDYAFTTYDQKQAKLNGNLPDGSLREETGLNQLQLLRSQLLRFSNCTIAADSCAFGEFGPPDGEIPPSIVYTATVTSLMCEENVEDQFVCGMLNYLSNITDRGVENYDIDFHGQISFATRDEETWFVRAILRQTFSDCQMRECTKTHKIKRSVEKLVETFYLFDNLKDHDIRIEAALASVVPRILSGNLRQRIREKADTTRMPYWHVPSSLNDIDVDQSVIKSMDVTANSLALLAFVNQSAEVYDHYRSQFNLPRLAEWIIEEQTSNQRFQTAIDTFYAWRALYRYNERIVGPRDTNNIRIQLLDAGVPLREYTNKDMPFSLQIPSKSRNFTLHTIGDGRIVVGVRVLASPRKRSKRTENNIPSILITAQQSRIAQTDNYVIQLVCIKTKSKMLKSLEVDHNLYTGFSTDFSKFQLLTNTTEAGVSLIGAQRVTSQGLHFILNGLTPETPACYEVVIREPVTSYTPEYLAPVTIEAYFNQISGQTVLSASDIRTFIMVRHKRRHSKGQRSKRDSSSSSELVDTICLDHGNCVCSELSCSARCQTCIRKNDHKKLYDELINEINAPGKFGILAKHVSSTTILMGNQNYTRAVMEVATSFGEKLIFGCVQPIDQFILWIRSCNKLSCSNLIPTQLYIIIGSQQGFFEDTVSTTEDLFLNSTQILMKHYLLRDGDRIDGGVQIGSNDSHSTCQEIIKNFTFFRYSCEKKK